MNSKRKRILIAADSMAMPRSEVKYEDTWICMLKDTYHEIDFLDRTDRGSTTNRLVTEGGGGIDLLELYSPDMAIIQMGITECAPRLFKKHGFEHFFLTRLLPGRFRPRYVQFIKRKRGRNPEITDMSPENFRANITNYFDRARTHNCSVVVILISRPNSGLLKKSPHAGTNIALYNNIYREAASGFSNVTIVEPFDDGIDIDEISIDEIHHDASGSRIIFDKLKRIVDNRLKL